MIRMVPIRPQSTMFLCLEGEAYLSAFAAEQSENLCVSVGGGVAQRGHAIVAGGVHGGVKLQQEGDHVGKALLGLHGQHRRAAQEVSTRVGVGTRQQHQATHLKTAM